MIFLTVGSELPFDRLVAAVDDWAAARERSDIFGQLADLGRANYRPRHFRWLERLDPPEFQAQIAAADCIVGHAGMGTIIDALTRAKPLLIMPRRAEMHETRNDHQVATVERFRTRLGIRVAMMEDEVAAALDALVEDPNGRPPLGPFAEPGLIAAIRKEIFPHG